MKAILELGINGLLCYVSQNGSSLPGSKCQLPLRGVDGVLPWMHKNTERYADARKRTDDAALLDIGRSLFNGLNQKNGWAKNWIDQPGPRILEVRIDEVRIGFDPTANISDEEALLPTPEEALLSTPWELLAVDGEGHLIDNDDKPFSVVRRIGEEGKPYVPTHKDFYLAFMAAAPEGKMPLDYEAEEAAILEAAQVKGLSLFVEESGELTPLLQRLSTEGPFQALHLSCHGAIDFKAGPWLALEDKFGGRDPVDIKHFVSSIDKAKHRPPLFFLSACRTAERALESFVSAIIQAGVPNVLGWDGSVGDTDAIAYAETFYEALAEYNSVIDAAMAAQRKLRKLRLSNTQHNQANEKIGRHWHLPRLYLGTTGGGKLVATDKETHPPVSTVKEFLDPKRMKVPVAPHHEFVGRRHTLQKVLQHFIRDNKPAVLIHGMGCHGKSSVAYRISDRMRGTHTPVVVWGKNDAAAIFDRLLDAIPAEDRMIYAARWQEMVSTNPSMLKAAIKDLLDNPFRKYPILLIIDDLEQILEEPQPNTPIVVCQEYRVILSAVLQAFSSAVVGNSRLLLTSRFLFTLLDEHECDLAQTVAVVPLGPMNELERGKQWQTKERIFGRKITDDKVLRRLLNRAIIAAKGNPGVQNTLTHPLVTGEVEAARMAIEAIEYYLEQGRLVVVANGDVAENAAVEQLLRLAFDKYREALSEKESVLLSAARVITPGFLVPSPVMEAMGRVAGVKEPKAAVRRLRDLGLFDEWGDQEMPSGKRTLVVSANPLACPLAERPTDDKAASLASEAVAKLGEYWRHPVSGFSRNERAVEVARLALIAGHQVDAALLNDSVEDAAQFLFEHQHNASQAYYRFTQPALNRLSKIGVEANPGLWLTHGRCAQRLGELAQAIEAFRASADGFGRRSEERGQAIAWGCMADILQARGKLDEALRIRQKEELPVYKSLSDVREYAVTMGKIADIYQSRGELNKALRIRQEEELPVYESLRDIRERAVAMSKIADIYQSRGEVGKALKILEEQLSVLEKLGDVHSHTVMIGKIADIYQSRGELDKAMRIRQEEELPMYKRLGDIHACAVTMGKIADIYQSRGKLNEAMQILEEQLPVFESLNDVRERAVMMGKIANIYQSRGKLNEAMRILEEQLPVFESLDDVRSRAVTMGKIADIYLNCGELDKAQQILEEQLLVYESLGDIRERALTMCKIADIYQSCEKLDEAMRILEEQLPVFKELGDVRSRAVTMGMIADIYQSRGKLDEAMRIWQNEELPVYKSLNDVRSCAITMGKIADSYQSRGKLDEALRILEEQLPIFKSIGDIYSCALTMGQIADIQQKRGELNEALRMYKESLSEMQQLQNVQICANLWYRIAIVLAKQEKMEEALEIYQKQAIPLFLHLKDTRSISAVLSQIIVLLNRLDRAEEAATIRENPKKYLQNFTPSQ
ncbi:MAG: tetratricopeptide repeat protein [Phycisphaerales bacterium]|nr:tetratricopeptide repeat protein [Phycisphaerales bacterium]